MLKIRPQQFDQLAKDLLKNDEENLVVQVTEKPESAVTVGKGSLVIRKEQEASLSKVSLAVFEDRMIQHLNEFFPQMFNTVGENQLRPVIRQGIVQAGIYGISNEIDVARYIDLSFVLGLDFDSGKQHPQAAEIIKDQNLQPGVRMQLIFDYVKSLHKERNNERSHRVNRTTA